MLPKLLRTILQTTSLHHRVVVSVAVRFAPHAADAPGWGSGVGEWHLRGWEREDMFWMVVRWMVVVVVVVVVVVLKGNYILSQECFIKK